MFATETATGRETETVHLALHKERDLMLHVQLVSEKHPLTAG